MTDEIKQFIIESLAEMNYDVDGVDDATTLGPDGADLQSLALAELAIRVEDRYGVRFSEDEAEKLATMTIGEFSQAVAERLDVARASGE
jgi:acyl carrier protein